MPLAFPLNSPFRSPLRKAPHLLWQPKTRVESSQPQELGGKSGLRMGVPPSGDQDGASVSRALSRVASGKHGADGVWPP